MRIKSQNLVWDKYWKLTCISVFKSNSGLYKWIFKCDCWNIKETYINYIRRWNTKSCWCLRKITWNIKHWLTNTRLYNIWQWMKQRCNNPNHDAYNRYWWRWIKIEWNTIEEFYKDMKEWYSDNLTIDRIDNNWNYCKDNCRWSTYKEQLNNTRVSLHKEIRIIQKEFKSNIKYILNTILIIHNWIWLTMKDWCIKLWLNYSVVTSRVSVMWWTKKEALWLHKRIKYLR